MESTVINRRHFKILDLSLDGMSSQDIANYIEMPSSQVSVIVESPSFQYQLVQKLNKEKVKC